MAPNNTASQPPPSGAWYSAITNDSSSSLHVAVSVVGHSPPVTNAPKTYGLRRVTLHSAASRMAPIATAPAQQYLSSLLNPLFWMVQCCGVLLGLL